MTVFDNIETAPAMQMVYHGETRAFFIPDDNEQWIPVTESRAKALLTERGYEPGFKDPAFSVGAFMNRCVTSESVCHAAPLAGWKAGVYSLAGDRFLVTKGPYIPNAKQGDCGRLRGVLEGLLGEDQLEVFSWWLQRRRKSVMHACRLEGQALFLVGPPGSGKSFLQSLVTESLGGRVASPWRYLTGETPFNGDLVGCEHLAIEDESPSQDIRTRRRIGTAIKSMLYAESQSCHPKGRNAITLCPRWTMTFSLNDEPENLMVIPPLDPGIQDKISILKCHLSERNPPDGKSEREWLREIVKTELPAFLYCVDNMGLPPEDQRDCRSGIKAFRHADVEAALYAHEPESVLCELIDAHVTLPWSGSAMDLEKELRTRASEMVSRLLPNQNNCSKYLGRLSNKLPERFKVRHIRAGNVWSINPEVKA